jgi:fucose permease
MPSDSNRRTWTAGIFLYVALLGVSLQLRGALLPNFQSTFGVSESALGLVSTVSSLGFLLTIFAVGMSVSRIDVRRFLLGGFAASAVLFWLLSSASSYWMLLGIMGLGGLFRGVLHGLDRPLLSHLYPENRGRMFNVEDMVWAIGATIGPLLATAVLAVDGWRLAYVLLGLGFLPLIVLVWRLDVPDGIENEQELELGEIRPLLAHPTVASMAVAMLLLAFIEGGIFTWLPYYANQSLPRSVANLSLSGYLAMYIPGRLFFGWATDRFSNLDLVLGAAIVAVGALYVGFVLTTGYPMLGAVLVIGFLVAGMFPTLLAWATNAFPQYSGPMGAVALGTSSIGFLIFPATMGVVADVYRVQTAMQLLVAVMAALAVVMAAIRLHRGATATPRPDA